MITKKENSRKGKVEIDLTGPDGNAFVLMGYASRLGKQLGFDKPKIDSIIEDMKSSDYEHLLELMENNFGAYIIMYR